MSIMRRPLIPIVLPRLFILRLHPLLEDFQQLAQPVNLGPLGADGFIQAFEGVFLKRKAHLEVIETRHDLFTIGHG